jgi:hypothetical protein
MRRSQLQNGSTVDAFELSIWMSVMSITTSPAPSGSETDEVQENHINILASTNTNCLTWIESPITAKPKHEQPSDVPENAIIQPNPHLVTNTPPLRASPPNAIIVHAEEGVHTANNHLACPSPNGIAPTSDTLPPPNPCALHPNPKKSSLV